MICKLNNQVRPRGTSSDKGHPVEVLDNF